MVLIYLIDKGKGGICSSCRRFLNKAEGWSLVEGYPWAVLLGSQRRDGIHFKVLAIAPHSSASTSVIDLLRDEEWLVVVRAIRSKALYRRVESLRHLTKLYLSIDLYRCGVRSVTIRNGIDSLYIGSKVRQLVWQEGQPSGLGVPAEV